MSVRDVARASSGVTDASCSDNGAGVGAGAGAGAGASAGDRATVLVLGASGYVGQFVVQRLCTAATLLRDGKAGSVHAPVWLVSLLRATGLDHTSNLRVVATFGSSRVDFAGAEWVKLDLADAAAADRVIGTYKPAVVVNCAALASLGVCEKEPDRARAINCPSCLLASLKVHAPSALVVHMSTDCVYGSTTTTFDEAAAVVAPLNVYGASKAGFETALKEQWPAHVVLRSSNIIGPPPPLASRPPKFLQWLHGKLLEGGATVFQDEKRRFIYVEDVVHALCHFTLHALASGGSSVSTPATFHLGGPALCSRLDVARSVLEVCRLSPTTSTAGASGDAAGGRVQRAIPTLRSSISMPYESGMAWDMSSEALEGVLGTWFVHPHEVVRRVFTPSVPPSAAVSAHLDPGTAFVQQHTAEAHAEGGFWSLLFRSRPCTTDPRYCGAADESDAAATSDAARPAVSSILYTLTASSPRGFFHRNADSDIMHVWHSGDALVYRVLIPAPLVDELLPRTLVGGVPATELAPVVDVPTGDGGSGDGAAAVEARTRPSFAPCLVAGAAVAVHKCAEGGVLVSALVSAEHPTLLVPAGTWKASQLSTWVTGAASVGVAAAPAARAGFGTVVEVVTPGFNPDGHTMAGLELARQFPAFGALIRDLVRADEAVEGYEAAVARTGVAKRATAMPSGAV